VVDLTVQMKPGDRDVAPLWGFDIVLNFNMLQYSYYRAGTDAKIAIARCCASFLPSMSAERRRRMRWLQGLSLGVNSHLALDGLLAREQRTRS